MNKIPYFDGHCDTVYRCYCTGEGFASNGGHIALDRLSGFDPYAQIFTFFWDAAEAPERGMLAVAKEMYALFRKELELNADRITQCFTADDIIANAAQGKTAALLSIEGADLLNCAPENIALAHDWGVKLINPTWNRANALSGSHCEDSHRGLSHVGRAFVKEANAAGILIDVSHLSERGFWDLMELTDMPVVASHSNARSVYGHSRSLTDDQFRAVCQTGGTVGLNFYTGFVGQPATLEMFRRHLEHFLELGGENTVALGADFDGCDSTVEGINGVQDIPVLWQHLERCGYDRRLLEKLFWSNWLKLF